MSNEAKDTNIYEYEDINDENTRNRTDEFQSHHSSRSDILMNQNSESLSSQRRRINVIAASTSGMVNVHGSKSGGLGSKRHHPNVITNHHHSILFRPAQRVVFYSPPRQRQKWGDSQVLPRVNWFDLFFDLFYVGATYNVSSILYNAPNLRGLLYAAGTFFPVMNIWMDRTYYEGRYVMDDDIFHRLSVIFAFTLVGFTIANIRTVDILADASNESSMFFFSLMLVIERIFSSLIYTEIYFYGVGQPKQIKSAATRDCLHLNYSLPFYFAAMMVSALKYFGNDSTMNRRFIADTASYNSDEGTTDLPITLCLIGCVVKLLLYAVMVIFCLPKDGMHKEVAVPLNVDFIIHRNGEWMMLMLGESIFSLLIVDVQDKGLHFYLVFYFSLLTVILLQLLHFQSQPHQADLHAVRRNKNRGMLWSLSQTVYSLSLVIMGASYTFFLLYADENVDDRRLKTRQLASASSGSSSDRIGAAHLYSGALSIVFLSLTIMNVLHKSSEELQVQCLLKAEKRYAATLVAVIRLGIVVVAGTISQWTLKPTYITVTGLLCVIADLSLRKIESISEKKHDPAINLAAVPPPQEDESEEALWPNVMHASVDVEN